jgi:hypothetical protein
MFNGGRALRMLALVLIVGACNDDNPVAVNPPDAPTGVAVAVSGASLMVSWNAVTGATAYDVERQESVGGADFETLAEDVTTTSYTDDTVTPGVEYLYRVIATNADGSSAPSDPEVGELPSNIQALSGTITTDVTLDASQVYIITGIVAVDDGASLTIPAGTLLRGSVTVQPSALMVRKGGQIFSNGTAAAPVVFTSDAPVGQRARGDWGGVVLNGRSICNFLTQPNPESECVGEGAAGPYGEDPPVLDDDSGVMTYTRVEFAGYEVSFGNELNALTMNAVGSGTEIHHVQTHYGSDDGFEWFGGTVDLKYALATGISDDSFDYSTGWQGRGQFWIAQQDPNDADNGFEVDGNENDATAQPYTDPTVYNVTLVGKGVDGAGGTAGESTNGMLLRLGTSGDIYNAIVMGFGTSGIDIDGAETTAQGLTINNSIIGLNANEISGDSDSVDDVAFVTNFGTNQIDVDPELTAPFNRTAPDFRPAAGSPALADFATPPVDGFFDAVDFIGGADPDEATPWYTGWTTTAQN